MKKNLVSIPVAQRRAQLNRQLALQFGLGAIIILINILLCVFRQEETHTLFLMVNIFLDIIVFWGIYTWYILYWEPECRKCDLVERSVKQPVIAEGTVLEIGEECRQRHMACRYMKLDQAMGCGIFFVPEELCGAIHPGLYLRLSVAENIVVAYEELRHE